MALYSSDAPRTHHHSYLSPKADRRHVPFRRRLAHYSSNKSPTLTRYDKSVSYLTIGRTNITQSREWGSEIQEAYIAPTRLKDNKGA